MQDGGSGDGNHSDDGDIDDDDYGEIISTIVMAVMLY